MILYSAEDTENQEYESQNWFFILLTTLKQYDLSVAVLPLFYELVFDMVSIMQAYFLEWDINLVPAGVKFNNLRAMQKLPWVGHVVTSPAAMEGEQNYKVTYFKVGDLAFHSVSQDELDYDAQNLK